MPTSLTRDQHRSERDALLRQRDHLERGLGAAILRLRCHMTRGQRKIIKQIDELDERIETLGRS